MQLIITALYSTYSEEKKKKKKKHKEIKRNQIIVNSIRILVAGSRWLLYVQTQYILSTGKRLKKPYPANSVKKYETEY